MDSHLYVLSFNPFGDNPNSSQVDIFVRSHRDVTSWYYPFLGTYFFRSQKGVVELAPSFRQFFGNSQFSLSFVMPRFIGGALPENAWAWINDGVVPTLSSPQ
jgi:hypothetical protein